MRAIAVVAMLAPACALSGAAAAVPELRVLRDVETTTCGDLVASTRHSFLVAAEGPPRRLVDADARSWLLDSPVEYEGDARRIEGRERHRVGDGAIEVRADLALDAGRFSVEVRPEPSGDFAAALAQYLPGVALPCRADGRLSIEREADSPADPARFARVQDLLHRATEALYVPDFAEAEARLAEAQSLDPQSDTVRWMRARARYLAGEALPREDVAGRTARFSEAEAFADQAVELAPDRAEGWLWRGVARGRLITTQGVLERAIGAVARTRGPAWVAACFERAIALRPTWHHFNHYAEGDALYGAAQLYRLLPEGGWAAPAIGVRGDLDRAVALARRALAMQANRIEYAKELGADLLCRGARRASAADVAEGRRVLRDAAALPVRSLYDRVDRHHVERLIDEPAERACDYSRDLWLDAASEEG
jgi:tetratricopeptide (TPR) repeat protein